MSIDPYATTPARQVWVDVAVRRVEWRRQAGPDHFEGLPAHDRRWHDEIDDAVEALAQSLIGGNEVDPRAAAIDVLAVVTALVEQMGD